MTSTTSQQQQQPPGRSVTTIDFLGNINHHIVTEDLREPTTKAAAVVVVEEDDNKEGHNNNNDIENCNNTCHGDNTPKETTGETPPTTTTTKKSSTTDVEIHDDKTIDDSSSSPSRDEPTITVVSNLDVYKGQTLEEKIESFIASHPVVMFHKTWCLFSLDAQSFLIEQMKVSLHAIEVDIHPQGRAILKYVQETNNHYTVPVIYVKGDFLGGYDDVNQLYATGRLQAEYLTDLTQADRCDEFISKGKLGTQPLFWFPETVNAHVVRLTGIMSCLCAALSAISVYFVDDWGRYVGYGLFLDYVLRLFFGSRISVLGRIAMLLASPFSIKPRHGRPKQFATMCGIMFSGLGSLFYILHFLPYHDYLGTAFMGGLAIASGMEGFLDFCLGCVFFKYGIKLGLIPR